MHISPFGNLSAPQIPSDGLNPFEKPSAFNGTDLEYQTVIQEWIDEVKNNLWPLYENGSWVGGAASFHEDATKQEVKLIFDELHAQNVLDDNPKIDPPRQFNHRFHYQIEDSLVFDQRFEFQEPQNVDDWSFGFRVSRRLGSNFLAYLPSVDFIEFPELFFGDADTRHTQIFSIKNLFQRPRPWTVATTMGLNDFVWHRATLLRHTGIHPAFPSGHCYQGIVHSGNVLQKWRDASSGGDIPTNDYSALQQYAVDFGDRRVFAGVHYPTDNISSWILALKLQRHMFDDADEIEAFAIEAIRDRSSIYKLIQTHYNSSELKPALELLNSYVPLQSS